MINGGGLFSQVLSLIDRHLFPKAVIEHQPERSSKGFSSWEQFVSLMFSQFAGANSLREISGGLATVRGKINHLGLSQAPKKSTQSYANTHRPWQFFETVFDWAHFRRTKVAVKLHLMLDHAGYLPCWAYLSDGKCADIKAARMLKLPAGAIVAMDRGYNDYSLFGRWCSQGVYFVTRLKDRADYQVVNRRPARPDKNVMADETIKFKAPKSWEKCPHHLRLVSCYNVDKKETMYFLTNNFKLAASTIAAIYKDRWQIELFFKAIKQNLKVKTFWGTSENAVKSQLWTALTAILLLKFLQLQSSFAWSLSNLVALLRMNLLTYRDLWAWINQPFHTAILEPPEQPRLFPA